MFGAQTTPIIFFWDKKDRPVAKNVAEDEPSRLVFDGHLRGSRFLVSVGGYVATEKQDKREAADDVNAFLMSVTLLRAHPLDPIGDNDLDVCDVDTSAATIVLRQGTLSRLGSAFALYPSLLKELLGELSLFPVSDAAILQHVVRLAEEIATSEYKVAFYQVLRAFSAKNDGETISAFLGSWIVLEMFVSTELRRFMASQGTPEAVISESLRSWTIQRKVTLLKRWNVLKPIGAGDRSVPTDDDLKEIRDLANVRNRVVHAGVRPSPQEAERVWRLAWNAMWRFLRFSGIAYQPYVDTVNRIHASFVATHSLS